MPVRPASRSTAPGKSRCSCSITKAITSPFAWQPKQYHSPSLALTENEGVFSVWNGQRPTQRCPTRRSWVYSLTTCTMSAAALTAATSSSWMPIGRRLPPRSLRLPLGDHVVGGGLGLGRDVRGGGLRRRLDILLRARL